MGGSESSRRSIRLPHPAAGRRSCGRVRPSMPPTTGTDVVPAFSTAAALRQAQGRPEQRRGTARQANRTRSGPSGCRLRDCSSSERPLVDLALAPFSCQPRSPFAESPKESLQRPQKTLDRFLHRTRMKQRTPRHTPICADEVSAVRRSTRASAQTMGPRSIAALAARQWSDNRDAIIRHEVPTFVRPAF